ncbi:MAG: hypothetical protein ACO1NW_07905 [Chitinophagaceae bacterium]
MAKTTKSTAVKHVDSPTSEDGLQLVFNSLKKLLQPHAKGNFSARQDEPGNYTVYYDKPVEMLNRHYPDVMFAAAIIKKNYVGFYFFPVYIAPELNSTLAPILLKCLKGKTCFHIKKNDPELMKAVSDALESGLQFYHTKGWK